jgi:hypothetical protein
LNGRIGAIKRAAEVLGVLPGNFARADKLTAFQALSNGMLGRMRLTSASRQQCGEEKEQGYCGAFHGTA